jgi:MFS family permease
VTQATYEYEVDDDALAAILAPRHDYVLETDEGPGRFGLAEGPFWAYERRVEVEPLEPADGGVGSGRHRVTERVEFRLAIPVFGWLFRGPVKYALSPKARPEPGTERAAPWWSPPDRLTARASNVLGLLCGLSVVAAYLGTLLSQTMTFAAAEFGADDAAQGTALAAVRIGVVASLFVAALADRRGRRRMLLVSLVLSCVASATTALAPGLLAFSLSQTASRGLVTAAGVLLGIIAVEEMPASSRAYAVSVMAMSGALGAGMVLWLLPLCDLDEQAWRLLFVVPILLIFAVRAMGRHLPESQRFIRAETTDVDDVASHTPDARKAHRRRLTLLASSALFVQIFFTPASQFFNEFLRDERGFSALQITFFQIITNLPGGIGIVVGGKLADTKGRRVVGSVGLIGGVGATVIMYNVLGWPMAAWSVIGAVLGAAVVPALGVYGPELFPTNLRGRANSVITLLGVTGSVIGLVAVGYLSDRYGSFGPAMAIVAIGPAILAAMVLLLYPETAHRELEEINPEDAVLRDIPVPPDEYAPDPRP